MKAFYAICLLIISMMSQAQEKPDTNFHLYLLIGQSNMAGRGVVDAESKQQDPQMLMLDSNNCWVIATDPVHFDKPAIVGVGPALSFAKEMLGNDKKIKIGLVPCAVGGSPIRVWEPGAFYAPNFHPYDDAMKRVESATKQGVLKGILWHQGESDNDSVHAQLYLEKLTGIINRIRSELHQPNLPFLAGEIGYFIKDDFINNVINQLPQLVPNTAVVSAKGLTDKGDHLHFDTPSARELGKRYAKAMKKLQKPENKK
jgi:hypothetical protein